MIPIVTLRAFRTRFLIITMMSTWAISTKWISGSSPARETQRLVGLLSSPRTVGVGSTRTGSPPLSSFRMRVTVLSWRRARRSTGCQTGSIRRPGPTRALSACTRTILLSGSV